MRYFGAEEASADRVASHRSRCEVAPPKPPQGKNFQEVAKKVRAQLRSALDALAEELHPDDTDRLETMTVVRAIQVAGEWHATETEDGESHQTLPNLSEQCTTCGANQFHRCPWTKWACDVCDARYTERTVPDMRAVFYS